MSLRTTLVLIVSGIALLRAVLADVHIHLEELLSYNFEDFLLRNELVAVMYSDRTQPKTRELLPIFSSLGYSPIFEKHGVRLARIDVRDSRDIAHKYRVKKSPSFALFSGGIQIRFEEKFSTKRFIEFVHSHLLFKVDQVATLKDAAPTGDFSVYYYSQNEDSLLSRVMRGVKRKHFSIQVCRLSQVDYETTDDQLIVKREHDGYLQRYIDELDRPQRIERLVIEAEYPDFSIYSKITQEWIDREGLPVVAVLMDAHEIEDQGVEFTAAKAAVKKFKHVVIAVFIDRANRDAPLLKEFSQINLDLVSAIIISPAKPYYKKYILKKSPEIYLEQNLTIFLQGFESENLPRYYLSQVVPDDEKEIGPKLSILTSSEVNEKLITRFDQVSCVLLHSGDSPRVGFRSNLGNCSISEGGCCLRVDTSSVFLHLRRYQERE